MNCSLRWLSLWVLVAVGISLLAIVGLLAVTKHFVTALVVWESHFMGPAYSTIIVAMLGPLCIFICLPVIGKLLGYAFGGLCLQINTAFRVVAPLAAVTSIIALTIKTFWPAPEIFWVLIGLIIVPVAIYGYVRRQQFMELDDHLMTMFELFTTRRKKLGGGLILMAELIFIFAIGYGCCLIV